MVGEVVRARCIRHVYPDRTEVNLCGLDLTIQAGERVAILGPNGSGKTTLLSHLVGLLRPVEGEVRVLGLDPFADFSRLRARVGVVLQDVDEQMIGPTVRDDVGFGLRSMGTPAREVSLAVDRVIQYAGLEPIRDKVVHYLSGGQKKKVAIAGAIVTKPDLLVLDEPFDGLDPRSRDEVIGLLKALNRDMGMTIVMTTHDMNLVPRVASMVYVINRGTTLAHGRPAEVLTDGARLAEAGMELPPLMELFMALSQKGVALSPPCTVSEALDQLLPLLTTQIDRRHHCV